MLLVDHDQSQLVERDRFLHERMRADDQVGRPPLDVRVQRVLLEARRAARQHVHAEARLRQQPRDVADMLRREDFRRRHEGHLQAVFHRHNRGQQRDDRLARADVSLQQPMHRLGTQQVLDDLFERLPLSRRQLERQDLRRRRTDSIVDLRHIRLQLHARRMAPPRVADLKEEELLENHPPLRGRAEGVQLVDLRFVGWKVRVLDRGAPRHEPEPRAHIRGQQIGNLRGKLIERLPYDPPLHVRRDRAGLLVERDDPRGPDRFELVGHQLELGVHEVQPGRIELHVAEDHHGEMRLEDVLQVRLVHPRAADGAARVRDDRMKDLEAAPARDREVRALDLAEHRRAHPRPKRRDRLHATAVFVAERKPVEKILDGDEAGAFEVRGFPRTHPFEELKRCR